MKELFDDIEKLRQQFESIERPILELETPPTPKSDAPSSDKSPGSPSSHATEETQTQKPEEANREEASAAKPSPVVVDPDSDLAKLESEFGKVGKDYSSEEIGDWEFDELEREFKSDSPTSK